MSNRSQLDMEDFLCDVCLTKVESNPSYLVKDFCDKCKDKVLHWLVDTYRKDGE